MKFKVGDKVRLTREILYEYACMNRALWVSKELIVNRFEGDCVFVNNTDGSEGSRKEENLELVPEAPEFEYGKIIEVSNDNEHWLRRMFIAKSNRGNYIGIDCSDPSGFVNGRNYAVGFYKYARKLTPKLTRKEIAEKFGVSEDFTLVD